MRIKQTRNQNTISLIFTSDLLINKRLIKVLDCFSQNKVYVNIFLNSPLKIDENKFILDNYFSIENDYTWLIEIDTKRILDLIVYYKKYISEMLIWDIYSDFESFCKDQQTPISFFSSLKKINYIDNSKFYMDYNFDEYNEVEIIFDLNLCSIDFEKSINEILEQ